MFDVPASPKSSRHWKAEIDLPEKWNVGLIVGPSGAGKSTIANECFGIDPPLEWVGKAVIDDFRDDISMQEIADICQAVGFNTIPAWLRPYDVLSTGEKFRVELARRLIESDPSKPLVIDEFTSVVDRQVAQIGAHAVQKWVRKHDRQFIAVSCHFDIIEWLQPDWILEPATMAFRSECLWPGRPPLEVTIAEVTHQTWNLFAPFHYLTADLHRSARCFCLFVGDEPAAFAGVLHRPHAKARNIKGVSRLVTLPDWQGLGLAFVLVDRLGAAYKADGYRLHTYPAHPALIHAFDRSKKWALTQKPGGGVGITRGKTSSVAWKHGVRPNAVFEYAGEAEKWW